MPILYLLAGPNGTGKTTFYSIAVESGFIDKNLPFINVDTIAQTLGGYSEENYIKASEIYRAAVGEYIQSDSDFMIESNLADSRSYEWLSLMKKRGYKLVLYYISTDDVLINIGRVERRLAEGGHNIPEAIIRTRYSQSHSYLKTKLFEFNEVYLIDNSTDTSLVQVKLREGIIVHKISELQDWIKNIISHVERFHKRKTM